MPLKRLQSSFPFLRRAPIRTWMNLTFILFVGLAVAVVGLYTFLVLRTEIRDAGRQTLLRQTGYLADQLEQAGTPAEMFHLVADISRLTDLRITLALGDSVLRDLQGGQAFVDRSFAGQREVRQALAEGTGFAERRSGTGRPVLYAALYRPASRLLVRLGQPEPPLYRMVRRMQLTLVVGMGLALVLALVGSWIAARRITGPLTSIRNSARRISEGFLDEKIAVSSPAAEIQDLAVSLNRMAMRFRRDIGDLQRVARVQNEFIGNVSHEVKNPIFAVGGYLEALASPDLPPDQRQRYTEKGLANLNRLNNLFSDLIEIARLEYREDLIRPEVFDLSALVDEVTETLRPKAREKGLTMEIENEPIEVMADRNRIRQVLTNLIDNAIAYTDEGFVRCRVRRHLDRVRVEIVDTGKGIGDEHLERVFERFYRVDAARSRKQGGTGLGLSIVKQILHAHGSSIHLESTLGRGSRFWFELPYAGEGGAHGHRQPAAARSQE